VAEATGTPVYLYSRAAIEDAYQELDRALVRLPHMLWLCRQSNGNLSILKPFARMGVASTLFPAVSWITCEEFGVRGDPHRLFGVGKDQHEIREALNYRPPLA